MMSPAPSTRRRALLIGIALAALAVAGGIALFVMPRGRRLPVEEDLPPALVRLAPYAGNPVFSGTGRDTWDRSIRERGYILFENGEYRLYYTGYDDRKGDASRTDPALGLATSKDGFQWTRYSDRPLFAEGWTEDVNVVHDERGYYMVAEGKDDVAHALSSEDGIHFREVGPLDIRLKSGEPIPKGHRGTPALWHEPGKEYLFYEREDDGIWLATSTDRAVWTNVDDEPVIPRGPDAYDRHAVALDQVVKVEGRYYAYYHGNAQRDREGPWTTSLAVSDDLINWKKYAKNPILSCDCSSAVLVRDDKGAPRLYTMHPDVRVWLPAP